jgi:hypothetical protein
MLARAAQALLEPWSMRYNQVASATANFLVSHRKRMTEAH